MLEVEDVFVELIVRLPHFCCFCLDLCHLGLKALLLFSQSAVFLLQLHELGPQFFVFSFGLRGVVEYVGVEGAAHEFFFVFEHFQLVPELLAVLLMQKHALLHAHRLLPLHLEVFGHEFAVEPLLLLAHLFHKVHELPSHLLHCLLCLGHSDLEDDGLGGLLAETHLFLARGLGVDQRSY